MSSSAGTTLLSNASATGSYVRWEGGQGVATFAGTFGGTSATLEYLGPDGATAIPVAAMSDAGVQTTVALTAAGAIGFILPPGRIRATLTGGTPSAMYAQADRIPS
jgi:uncharacterized protein (DUF2345 family)